MKANLPKDINEYISGFPQDIQDILQKIRSIIHETVPEAKEKIAYSMPTFTLNGKNMIHFAALKNHIGFYPTPSGINKFEKQLTPYHTSKGAIQFPINQPIPYELIQKIVKFRKEEIITQTTTKNGTTKNH